jgi:hypothetical protein
MFGIAFDDRGNGLVTEPGSALYDEINSQIKGGNYGWRTLQGANMPPNPLANDSSIKPLRSYFISENPTQAAYYNGDKHGELKDKFIVGSFRGDLYAYKISQDGKKLMEELRVNTASYPSREVVSTAVSPKGDIYFGAYDIFRLEKIDSTSKDEIMFPIQINSTDIDISNLTYTERTKEIMLDLTKKYGFSSFSIKIPKSILEYVPAGYGCQPKNNSPSKLSNEVPYEIAIHRDEDYNIITVHIEQDVPENLKFTVNTEADESSKLNMCLIQR